jgi:hypothetical protein
LGGVTHRYSRHGRRIDRKPAKLPIQANRTQAGGSDKRVGDDVVDLERTAIDVALRSADLLLKVYRNNDFRVAWLI